MYTYVYMCVRASRCFVARHNTQYILFSQTDGAEEAAMGTDSDEERCMRQRLENPECGFEFELRRSVYVLLHVCVPSSCA